MHDALSTSDPQGNLQFQCKQPDALQRYRFGLETADFLICRNCGVYIGAIIEARSDCYGIINTHALSDGPVEIADAAPISYANENAKGRIRRRVERWTPVTSAPS